MKYQFNFAFDDILIEKFGYEPVGQVILVVRAVMDAIRLAEKNKVVFVTDDLDAKTLFETTVIGNGEFGCDDECIFIETSEINNKTDMSDWLEWSKGIDMDFSAMVINPPYSIGNKIISDVVKHLDDDGKAIVIQPLNQYKQQKLYEHIEQFELADPKVFEDAEIGKNLCICSLTKKPANVYDWESLRINSYNENVRIALVWNINNFTGITVKQKTYSKPTDFDINTTFIDSQRIFSVSHGAIPSFRKQSICFNYNNFIAIPKAQWPAGLCVISGFKNKKAKANFSKFAYNYNTLEERKQCLAGLLLGGLNVVNTGNENAAAIPQIDWETIDQHPLWNTDIDGAVLDAMGLKWNDDKTKIIEK